jgi:hypothetical protein
VTRSPFYLFIETLFTHLNVYSKPETPINNTAQLHNIDLAAECVDISRGERGEVQTVNFIIRVILRVSDGVKP